MTWNHPFQAGPMTGYDYTQVQRAQAQTQSQVQGMLQSATQTSILLPREAQAALAKMKFAAAGWKEAQEKIDRTVPLFNKLEREREEELEKPREQIDFAKVGMLTRELSLASKDNTQGYLARGRARHDFDEAEHAFMEALRNSNQIPKLE